MLRQVGLDWNEAYSKLCSTYRRRKERRALDEIIRAAFRASAYRSSFFIDESGILCHAKPERRERKPREWEAYRRVAGKHFAMFTTATGDAHWFELLMAPLPAVIVKSGRAETAGRSRLVCDLYLGNYYDLGTWHSPAVQQYGARIYPKAKRQVSAREIRKYGLRHQICLFLHYRCAA